MRDLGVRGIHWCSRGILAVVGIVTVSTLIFWSSHLPYIMDIALSEDNKKEIHNVSPHTKQKRWAVMMIGSPRTYAFARTSFIQNVLNQTHPPMDMDIFTSTSLKTNSSSCPLESHGLQLLQDDSTVLHIHNISEPQTKSTGTANLIMTKDRFLHEQSELLQIVEEYSKQKGVSYEYILYTRPDLHYTTPFNFPAIERQLQESNSTMFSPKCCSFKGWCDRLAILKYQDYSKMIRSTQDWLSHGGDKFYFERAFQERAEYVNLTKFDLEKTKDYGFHTLRLNHTKQSCEGKWTYAFWVDMLCNDNSIPQLEVKPETCSLLLNNSNPSCRYINR